MISSHEAHRLLIEKMYFWSIFLGLSLLLVSMKSLINKGKSKRLPPGPAPLPIIGNLHNLGKKPHQSLADLAKIYGPIMSLKLGQITTIIISSSSTAKEVLQKQDLTFSSRFIPDSMHAHNQYQFSVGFLPVGPRWRSLRKIMTAGIFSSKGLDAGQKLRSEKVHELIAFCGNSCKDGKSVDICRAAFLTSLNIMFNTLFSRDLTDANQDFVKELKELMLNFLIDVGKPNYADFFPVLKKIDPQGIRRRTTVYLGKFLELVDVLVKERLELRKVQKTTGTYDLLEFSLDICEEDPEEIDVDHIRRMCLDLFIAGTDTTSSTIEWGMAELLCNPEIMVKAKAELDQVKGKGKVLEEEDISKLPYLQCIVKETLRLHPSTPFLLPRKVETDVEVNGYIVPKGSQVLVNAWGIGRDPNLWLESKRFNPERFLTSERNIYGTDFELIPFGAGRRICPGLPMAMRVVHVSLGSLINSFDWTLESGIEPKDLDMNDKFGLSLHKALPLNAVPKPLLTT